MAFLFSFFTFLAYLTVALAVGIPFVLFLGHLDNYPQPTNTKPPHPPVEWM